MLHRLGQEAYLTLGNKKAVDIVIVDDSGSTVTVDVKGLAGRTSWRVRNLATRGENHFIVFVCFLGKIANPDVAPEVYVVPTSEVEGITYVGTTGQEFVELRVLRKKGARFKDAWSLIVPSAA